MAKRSSIPISKQPSTDATSEPGLTELRNRLLEHAKGAADGGLVADLRLAASAARALAAQKARMLALQQHVRNIADDLDPTVALALRAALAKADKPPLSTRIPDNKNHAAEHLEVAGFDFEPLAYDIGESEFLQHHEDVLNELLMVVRHALRTLRKTKAETIDMAHELEADKFDDGVMGLVAHLKEAQEILKDYAELLHLAELRMLVAVHNVWTPDGIHLSRSKHKH